MLALGTMLLRVTGILPDPVPRGTRTPSPSSTTTQSVFERTNIPAATASTFPTEEEGGLETPADLWANAVLDYVLPLLNETTAPVDDLTWWYTTPDGGPLAWENGSVTVDQRQIELTESSTVEIAISDPAHPNSLRVIGEAKPLDAALQLTVNSSAEGNEARRWLLTGATPVLALEALSARASSRDISLIVAYAISRSTMQVVLLKVEALATSTQQSETPVLSPPPTVAINPTSTRAPEVFLGEVVASRIDPGIDEAQAISFTLTQRFIDRHPWAGILAASEQGIRINNRATSIAHAIEFIVYVLQDTSGDVTRLFSVEYTEDATTRFPEDQLLFQAHRMEEILYWMVVRAAERDGQLIVAYDDSGDRQTITLIGFRKFADSSP
jgi:hypothetical protein